MKNPPSRHPYEDLPDSAYWKPSVANIAVSRVDPVTPPNFKIQKTEKIVSGGSCFAQHITKNLVTNGFNYHFTEKPHPLIGSVVATANSYGMFSARYGNIYTARQLLQLYQRAFGSFSPKDRVWHKEDQVVDPFRPRIQPGGFYSLEEFEIDQKAHLAAVRKAFKEMDVFIFTLGLTEAWINKQDGAVYPLAPGVYGGCFSDQEHKFHNFSVDETVQDLETFITNLRGINPNCRSIFTVSPVPLTATAERRHVLTSTCYSKAVLRVAAETICTRTENTYYFPSFEIVDGFYNRGQYFQKDCRTVTPAGVNHVMGRFYHHFTDHTNFKSSADTSAVNLATEDTHSKEVQEMLDELCDELVYETQRADRTR